MMENQKSKSEYDNPLTGINNSVIQKPSPAFAKYWHLERSGLIIVRLTDCDFDDAVRFYVELQKSNPLFISLGIVGNHLQKYAEFVIKTGLKFPFNLVAINNNSGRIEGIFISVISSEVVDDSELSDGARMHWRILYLADNVIKDHIKCNKHIVTAIVGWMPKHQGKGLFGDMVTIHGDLCSDDGIEFFTSYTANPNALQAYQNIATPGTKLPKAIAEKLLESHPSIVNNELVPKYRKAGIIPVDLEFRSTNFATFTRGIVSKNCIVFAGPVPRSDLSRRSRLQSRL